jgi:sulfur carrier protein ThiS adenylyltransferase
VSPPAAHAATPGWLSRNPPALRDIAGRRVGIIGLGGLGSNIAIMLARAGVPSLRLADFDSVSQENLNRQHYFPHHLGQKKTEALASELRALSPAIALDLWRREVEERDLEAFCAGCDVVVEAVDEVATKAMILSWFMKRGAASWLVTASGVGGLGPAAPIRTVRLADRIVACGDFETSSEGENGVCAPRVMLVASHQALAVLRILAGIER